ncbi:MAG: RES family NAD+ phosphorylase [Gallionellaceae bacterium]
MQVWRIATDTRDYVADDLSGAGAKATGGRWNSVGMSVLYCSDSPSLACLETLVHLGTSGLPFNRFLVAIEIPDAVWNARKIESVPSLKIGWDACPAGRVSIALGDAWLSSNLSAVLVVPSAICPEDSVILINSAHIEAKLIKAQKVRKWIYDPRLGK